MINFVLNIRWTNVNLFINKLQETQIKIRMKWKYAYKHSSFTLCYLSYSIICKSGTNETQDLNGWGIRLVNYCQSMPLFQDKCNPEWQYTYYYYKFLNTVLHYYKMSIYRVTLQISFYHIPGYLSFKVQHTDYIEKLQSEHFCGNKRNPISIKELNQ